MATLSSKPAATIVTNNDVPPAEKNGNVRPVTGNRPVTPPMLMMAWTPNQVAMPPASSIPNRSGAASAVWIPNHTNSPNPPTTASAPTNPSSSAITAKMKSLCASGRYPSLLLLPPMPEPVSPPLAIPRYPW